MIYCVKGYCGNSKTPNLCAAYKTKRSAQKSFDERVKSKCYDMVILCEQDNAFLPEHITIIAEYSKNTVVLADYKMEVKNV